MKKRIITAVVLVPLLLIIVWALPKIVTAILFGAMAAIGAYELLHSTGYVRHTRLVIYSMVMAFLVGLWSGLGADQAWMVLGVLGFTALLFGEMMLSHVKMRFEKMTFCMVAGLLVPFLFTSVVRIHSSLDGRFYIMVPLIMAFLPDTGAYFAGRAFGRHKLAPVISPNKTIEGAIGGVIACMLGMVIYGLILQAFFRFKVNYLLALLYGLLGSAAAVFGDLCFSVIKRQTGIKDYGNLFPGHGGVLDRFDSMMLVGPLMEALILIIPVAV